MQGAATAITFARPAWAAGEISSLRSTAKSWLWAPEDLAIERGLFAKSGLKVSMAATLRGVNQDALLSGAADILLGAPTQNMRVQIKGQPIKMICGFVNKYASNVVVKKKFADAAGVTEQSPVDAKARVLKGLRLGTTGPAAGPDQLLRYLLNKAKLNPERDAQLVPIAGGGQGMLAALQNDNIDGFCLSSPTSDVAVEKFGAVYLFNMATNPPSELNDYLYISASCSEKTLKEKSDLIVDYCKGIALALRMIHENPAEFRSWAIAWFKGLDPALLETAYKNNAGIYMKTPIPTQAQFDLNRKFLADGLKLLGQADVPAGFSFGDAFDLKYVNAAMKSI